MRKRTKNHLFSSTLFLTYSLLSGLSLLSCNQSSDTPHDDSCNLQNIEVASKRLPRLVQDQGPVAITISVPECANSKNIQLVLQQDNQNVTLSPQITDKTKLTAQWTFASNSLFHPGVVQAGLSIDGNFLKNTHLSLYHPDPFQHMKTQILPLDRLSEVNPSKVLAAGVGIGHVVSASFTSDFFLFFESNLQRSFLKYFYTNPDIILPSGAQGTFLSSYQPVTSLLAMTYASYQPVQFFLAVPEKLLPGQKESPFILNQYFDTETPIPSPRPSIRTGISSASLSPMLATDSEGKLVAIANQEGALEVYRFENGMFLKVRVSQFINQATFLGMGHFRGGNLPDVLVANQAGELYVLPYIEQTESLGEPVLIAQTKEAQLTINAMPIITIGDIDGDLLPDVVFASGNNIQFLLNQGTHGALPAKEDFAWAHYSLPGNPSIETLTISDMDQDGHNDVVLVTSTNTEYGKKFRLQILLGQYPGTKLL